MKRRILAVLAYILPTFPLGYFWHLTVFADFYRQLAVYRADMIIPLGVASMFIQGILWALLYERLFAGQPVGKGAVRFACFAGPLAWSFMVVAVSAKHPMTSVKGYLFIETAFVAIQYAVVSPLIALVYSDRNRTREA